MRRESAIPYSSLSVRVRVRMYVSTGDDGRERRKEKGERQRSGGGEERVSRAVKTLSSAVCVSIPLSNHTTMMRVSGSDVRE